MAPMSNLFDRFMAMGNAPQVFRKRSFWIALLVSSALALFIAGAAVAQDQSPRTPTDDQVNAVAKGLYCPVCENVPLDVCPTQACAQWRDLIREKLALGWSESDIKDYFVNQYGDRVLATPPARGLNWLVYIIPPFAILVGAFVLVQSLRAWKRPAPADPSPEVPPELEANEYIAWLEEELRRD